MKRLGIVVPMEWELRPLAKRVPLERAEVRDRVVHTGRVGDVEIKATLTKIGTAAARTATEFVLDDLDVDHVALIGIAGGLGPDVQIGDLVVPEVVVNYDTGDKTHPTPIGSSPPVGVLYTSSDLIVDQEILRGLADEGALAIDMETAMVGAVCEERGVPWSVYRGISDHIRDALIDADLARMMTPNGGAKVGPLLRYLAPKPWRVRTLITLTRGMNVAANAAADALVSSLRALQE